MSINSSNTPLNDGVSDTTIHPTNHAFVASGSNTGNKEQEQQNQNGIDFQKAMEILAVRDTERKNKSSTTENRENVLEESSTETNVTSSGICCGCNTHRMHTINDRNLAEECKQMGQVIDLFDFVDDADTGGDANHEDDEDDDTKKRRRKEAVEKTIKSVEEKKAALDSERTKRLQAIEDKLKSMSVRQLLQTVLETQQQRVLAYQSYDKGLEIVLKTKNVTNYPQICAEATAAFSVVSDTMNAIQRILEDPKHYDRTDLKDMIHALQMHEKEKLNLTAAMHLEKIREQNQQSLEEGNDDKRISNLLRQGIQSLNHKLGVCIEQINEDIEEIRCAILDE